MHLSTKLLDFTRYPQNWCNFQRRALCCICIALVWHKKVTVLYSRSFFKTFVISIMYSNMFTAKIFSLSQTRGLGLNFFSLVYSWEAYNLQFAIRFTLIGINQILHTDFSEIVFDSLWYVYAYYSHLINTFQPPKHHSKRQHTTLRNILNPSHKQNCEFQILKKYCPQSISFMGDTYFFRGFEVLMFQNRYFYKRAKRPLISLF